MLPVIPTLEPTEFAAGETLVWNKSFDDYLPGDGWVLTYYLRGAGPGLDIVAATDDVDAGAYKATATATQTATLTAGAYYWQAWISKGAEKHLVDEGEVTVKAGLSFAAATTHDGRSAAKKLLDAIDAMLAGKASLDQQSYQIAGRQLMRIPIADLLKLRETYAAKYAAERRRARIKKGGFFMKNAAVRFGEPK